MNWKEHWDTFPSQFAKDEFLRQVGKTVQGQTITITQFDTLVSALSEKLDLNQDDWVLDLCCGNGLITYAIAQNCHSVTGVDFSKPLIEIAREYHGDANVNYFNLSILDITSENIQMTRPFTKLYMYEALQYFKEEQLPQLFETLLPLTSEKSTLLFTSIPDENRLWEFYNTPERKREYLMRKQKGTDAIGTWWKRSSIQKTCDAYGLQCEFLPQPAGSHTVHYRFDVRLKKQ